MHLCTHKSSANIPHVELKLIPKIYNITCVTFRSERSIKIPFIGKEKISASLLLCCYAVSPIKALTDSLPLPASS